MGKYSDYTIEELEEFVMFGNENLGELIAQHRAETAAFGDSWPGAQIQIQNLAEDLRNASAELDRRVKEDAEGFWAALLTDADNWEIVR